MSTSGTRQVEEEGKVRCQLVKEIQGSNGGLEVEVEVEEEEVWPVEHPMEPMEEDRPVICPIPTSSLLPREGRSDEKVESWRKRAENPMAIATTMPIMVNNNMDRLDVTKADHNVGSIRKRYHAHSSQRMDDDNYRHHPRVDGRLSRVKTLPLPSNNNVTNTIFHMLQRAP